MSTTRTESRTYSNEVKHNKNAATKCNLKNIYILQPNAYCTELGTGTYYSNCQAKPNIKNGSWMLHLKRANTSSGMQHFTVAVFE